MRHSSTSRGAQRVSFKGRGRRSPFILLAVLSMLVSGTAVAGGPTVTIEASAGLMGALGADGGTTPGPSASLLVGLGGRPAGWWPRFYLVAEASAGSYSRTVEQNFRDVEVARSALDFGAGLRIVLPLSQHVRVYGDVLAVSANTMSEFSGDRVPNLESRETVFGLRTGAGLQFRFFESLALGARVTATPLFGDYSSRPNFLDEFTDEAGRFDATLQASLFF